VEELLEDTEVPGVSRLNLRHFVSNPVQVVIRMPEVLAALREIVDVVILEVPSYLTVHHGEGLTPMADVVLVVAERDATTVDQVRRTGSALKRLGAPVIGMALTSAETQDWDIDSGFGTEYGRMSDGFDKTEPVPVINPRSVTPAAPFDDRATVDRALPEA
jgi:Mrp family chromosome partitioning ATPase